MGGRGETIQASPSFLPQQRAGPSRKPAEEPAIPDVQACSKCGALHDPKKCQGHSKRSGKQCQRPGADLLDGRRLCRIHGLRSPQTQQALVARKAEQAVTKQLYQRGIREVVNPLQTLMDLVSETVAFKELLEEQIAAMQSEDWRYQSKLGAEQLDSRVALYERALDRTGKLLTDVARLGLEAKAMKLEEDKIRLVLAALDAALAGRESADEIRQAFIRQLRA